MSELNSEQDSIRLAFLESKIKFVKMSLILGIVFTSLNFVFVIINYFLGSTSYGFYTYIRSELFFWITQITGLLVITSFILLIIGFLGIRSFLPYIYQKKLLNACIILAIASLFNFLEIIMYILAVNADHYYGGTSLVVSYYVFRILYLIFISIPFAIIGKILYDNKILFNNKTKYLYSSYILIGLSSFSILFLIFNFISSYLSIIFYFAVMWLFPLIFVVINAELLSMFTKITPSMFEASEKTEEPIEISHSIIAKTYVSSMVLNSKLKQVKTGLLFSVIFTSISFVFVTTYSIFSLTNFLPYPLAYYYPFWLAYITDFLVIIPFIVLIIVFFGIRLVFSDTGQKKLNIACIFLAIAMIFRFVDNLMFLLYANNAYGDYSLYPIRFEIASYVFHILYAIFIAIPFIIIGLVLHENKNRFQNKIGIIYSSFVLGLVCLVVIIQTILNIFSSAMPIFNHTMMMLLSFTLAATVVELYFMFDNITLAMLSSKDETSDLKSKIVNADLSG